ncbi:hypothetical protein Sulac_1192 [Sulfobacillus acidophilus DSM 10332]|uniref:Uncharacterized protein n=1 Tax=Sulfobacillus acidophilus (strain ATCC 700253 / DSM 10332 / NAL) TaxID=679936 RepID=G8TUP5_SULAD|nr:hypothetical protein Sulac_1192 [Sulfobacillus acidophilus DSM 10332]
MQLPEIACAHCAFSVLLHFPKDLVECHRFPPTGGNTFPQLLRQNWCTEFQPRPQSPTS